jgi:hypothetical protein
VVAPAPGRVGALRDSLRRQRHLQNDRRQAPPRRERNTCAASGTFDSVDTGRFNGVWTQKVAYTLDGFDYDPDATPTGSSWADFLSSVFHLTNPDAATTTSYEFDYYNACGNHWRDSFYNGSFIGSGSIGDCP